MENINVNKVIDIHIHLIPKVDDGAGSFEEAEGLLRQAISQGIKAVIATPHSNDAFFDNSENTYEQYCKLRRLIEAKNMDIEIYLGSEVRCKVSQMDKILKALKSKKLPSLNNSKYVLVELCAGRYILSERDMIRCIDRLRSDGWIPVIAHAERYYLPVKIIKEMKKRGCLIQMNMYSVADDPDEKIREGVAILLKEKLVDFVGTDAHRLKGKRSYLKIKKPRPVKVEKAIAYLYRNYEKEYIDDILYHNAKNMLLNE